VFGFTAGLRQSLLSAGEDRNVIVMARGVTSENESFVPHQAVEILRVRPEIATNPQHQALLSRESIVGVNVSRARGAKEFALLRSVEPIAYEVHPKLRLVQGHWPVRGNGEWVVGRRLLARFPYLQPGTAFHYEHRDWKIVGVFSDNDSARESERKPCRSSKPHRGRFLRPDITVAKNTLPKSRKREREPSSADALKPWAHPWSLRWCEPSFEEPQPT
jgi:putative ABC transport system permease protein